MRQDGRNGVSADVALIFYSFSMPVEHVLSLIAMMYSSSLKQ